LIVSYEYRIGGQTIHPFASISRRTSGSRYDRRRRQRAPERRLRIRHEHREIPPPVVPHDERPIIGDHLGTEREPKQRQEDPQRPVPAPARPEDRNPPARERESVI
jgi:hypothetical protein